jgi:hypothetical protein
MYKKNNKKGKKEKRNKNYLELLENLKNVIKYRVFYKKFKSWPPYWKMVAI